MPKTLKTLIILIGCALLSPCSKTSDIVVAHVDEAPISASMLKAEMAHESAKYDPAALTIKINFDAFRSQSLEKLIQQVILLGETKKLNISVSDEEQKRANEIQTGGLSKSQLKDWLKSRGLTLDEWNEYQENRLLIEKLIKREIYDKVPVPEKDIQDYYRSHIQEFRQPTQFHARQIIVDTKEQAEEIVSKLKKGEDFAQLAEKYSLSPDSKHGGDLGYFDAGAYPEVFAEVCQNLEIGETSDAVATDYGHQIFQLLDRRPTRQLSLEEVTPSIKKILSEDQAEEVFKKWFEQLRASKKIEIDERALLEVTLDEKG